MNEFKDDDTENTVYLAEPRVSGALYVLRRYNKLLQHDEENTVFVQVLVR